MRILGLDTSGKVASCAVFDTEAGLLLGEHSVYTTRTHSQTMLPMCISLLEECGMTEADVDCYAVSVGPGSYTGIRIGIAAVQGMAMVRGVPCIGVSTLEAMASRILTGEEVVSVMHARNDLFYAAVFEGNWRSTEDALVTPAELAGSMCGVGTLVGDGAEELLRQLPETGYLMRSKPEYQIAPPVLRLQSAAGVCQCAANYIETHETLPTAADLTASYLQAVNISKRKDQS